MPIEFIVPAVPVAQPRATISTQAGIPRAYVPTKHAVTAFKATCRQAAHEAMGQGAPLQGPIGLELTFILPRPKRLIWKSRTMHRVRHISKPDLDNLQKSVKDALSKLVWADDAQVCEVVADKYIASGDERPHVEVSVWQLSE